MPTSVSTEFARERFAALLQELVSRGLLGDRPAPLATLDYVAPGQVAAYYHPDDAGEPVPPDPATRAVIDGWDWSAAAHLGASRAAAVAALLTDTSPLAVAVRAFVRDLYTALNDEREARGLSRLQEPEIVARVVAGIGEGAGEPA